MSTPRERVLDEFERRRGATATLLARAPGRVNLIGDHTDYNDGFVLPMAIDRAVWIALRARDDSHVRAHSLDFESDIAFDASDVKHGERGWGEYVRGVTWALGERAQRDGRSLRGWEGVVAGDVPLGAGLSSSAALELATARALATVSGLPWHPAEMARLAQRAENVWVGVNCGIMDQLISAAGVSGHALLIDCRSLDMRAVPLPGDVAVVVLDTATRRGLVDSEYNERRARCESAAKQFGVRALRDVDERLFAERAGMLDEVTRRRARHVVTENARVLAAADALGQGDAHRVGELMAESHRSLRDDFQVSRVELDAMVEIALAQDGCYGARMTGAGFGGCAVALVAREAADRFVGAVATRYESAVGLAPAVYVCEASSGASLETL
ncbi:MAG TPA: galactokinase [Gemmatimonadaceae bacterium]|nr:galactokinase [Gemmatimonadaceae bacterium]